MYDAAAGSSPAQRGSDRGIDEVLAHRGGGLPASVRRYLHPWIRPVVFDVGRKLTAPMELHGYHLPAGVMVVPGIGLVHADPSVYDHPKVFNPDRMIGAAARRTVHHRRPR